MNRRVKLVVYIILVIVAVFILFLAILESTGRTNIIADYYSPSIGYDLTDGQALTSEDIQEYVESKNPNINQEVGLKLSHFCKKFNVNPAFVLAIAEADSSNGLYGVGRSYKNPGNTKISYQRLDQLGIGHASYKGDNNFAVFNNWADGYSAIAVTLANYSYYNMKGQIEPILRTYAGHPNPNYYATVRQEMGRLLSKINIKVSLKPTDNKKLSNCQVVIRKNGKKIAQKNIKNNKVEFNGLPRDQYLVRTDCKNYRESKRRLTVVSKTTKVDLPITPTDRAYISGRVEKLVANFPDNEGIKLILSKEDGEIVLRTKTAKNGFYYFGNLVLGNYIVTIEPETNLPTGFYFTKKVDLTKRPQEKVNFYY